MTKMQKSHKFYSKTILVKNVELKVGVGGEGGHCTQP